MILVITIVLLCVLFLAYQAVESTNRKATAIVELKAKEEAAQQAKAEAARQAKAETELKARAEAARQANIETATKARAEAEQQTKVEAVRQVELARLKAKTEAEQAEAKAEAERQAKVEAELKAKAQAVRQANAETATKASVKKDQNEAARNLEQKLVSINWHDQQVLNLCEENTAYCATLQARLLSAPHYRCFDVIKGMSSKQNDDVWEQLQQGVKQIDTPEQLEQYIFSYGNMHRAKLVEAYATLAEPGNLQLSGQKIEVFDYGCGQGIATVLLLDYLRAEHNLNCLLAQVVLIEPSALALKRAALHVKQSLAKVKLSGPVAAYQIELDRIESKHLKSCDETIKFHLFSNILDVSGVNMTALQTKLLASLTGINYFVCVSPRIWKNGIHERNQRLHDFFRYFENNCNATLIADRDTDVLCIKNRPHARFERVFRVNVDKPKVIDNIF